MAASRYLNLPTKVNFTCWQEVKDELQIIAWAYSTELISLETSIILQYLLLKSVSKDRELFQRLAESLLTKAGEAYEQSIVPSALDDDPVRAVVLSRDVQNFQDAFENQHRSFLCDVVDQGFERGFRLYLPDSKASIPAFAEFLLSPIFEVTSTEENPVIEHQRIYAFRWLIIDRRLPLWDSREAQACKVSESQVRAIDRVTKPIRAKLTTLVARNDIGQRTPAGHCSLAYLLSISTDGSDAQIEFLDAVGREANEEIDKESILAATFLCIAAEALDIKGLIRSIGEAAMVQAANSVPAKPVRNRGRSKGRSQSS